MVEPEPVFVLGLPLVVGLPDWLPDWLPAGLPAGLPDEPFPGTP